MGLAIDVSSASPGLVHESSIPLRESTLPGVVWNSNSLLNAALAGHVFVAFYFATIALSASHLHPMNLRRNGILERLHESGNSTSALTFTTLM